MNASWRQRYAALALLVLIGLGPAAARAQESMTENAGLGAAAALSTLVYGPVKLVYSLGGLIIGGFGYVLSGGDTDVMWRILNPSVRGDYVVMPAHLTGEKSLEFIGRDPQDQGYGS